MINLEKTLMDDVAKEVNAGKCVPIRSLLALGFTSPKVGKPFNCFRLDQSSYSTVSFCPTTTTPVQRVRKISSDVVVVTTRHSFYITLLLDKPVGDVDFCIITKFPIEGKQLHCKKLKFDNSGTYLLELLTSPVESVEFIKGIYRVETLAGSTYMCFLMF